VPRFDIDELRIGAVLGRGGFGTVLEIRGIELLDDDDAAGGDGDSSEGGKKHVKKKSHGFRLRRKRPEVIREGSDESAAASITYSKSMDACDDAINNSRNNNLNGIMEGGAVERSKSHDCVDGDATTAATSVVAGESNKSLRQSTKRSKALSWSNAKAHAHDVTTHFFHRGQRDHAGDHVKGGEVGQHQHQQQYEQEKEGGEKRVADGTNDNTENSGSTDVLSNDSIDGDTTTTAHYKQQVRTKQVSYDEANLKNTSSDHHEQQQHHQIEYPMRRGLSEGNLQKPKRQRQISRNFSFLAWRDSEAGEEGKDALSPEELDQCTSVETRGRELFGVCKAVETVLEVVKKEGEEEDGGCAAGSTSDAGGVHKDSALTNESGTSDNADAVRANQSTNTSIIDSTSTHSEPTKRRRRIILYQNSNSEDEAQLSIHDSAHQQSKQFISQHAITSDGNARYAIKIITPDIVQNDFKKFLQAAMDMATETYFLSVLSHPHILKMRAVGQNDMFSPDYFLVLDRLYDTLEDRIEGSWKEQSDHLENSLLVWNRGRKMQLLWKERMGVAKDLAGALNYLHELGIIYRDVKPENVGFDSRGVVKLFDFGLAKEVHKEDECANGTYKLTANTGSLRYMAPEVGNRWGYNFFADSYSFGIMLWEIAALEKPFATYTHNEIRDMVMKWGERPKLKEEWSDRVKELMKSSWDSNFRKRPTMKSFELTLALELEEDIVG